MTIRYFFLLAVAICVCSASLQAQGGDRADSAHVAELEAFQPGELADELPRSIDLRPWLPAIGTQTMNDCVAWAFGYAGRTYLEAVDQGWKPNRPDRIFSPTFIYNQINHGEDGGSQLPDALNLLLENGAATLETAPYLPKDFLTQPNVHALEEAEQFRILDYDVVQTVNAIKVALAEGGIVLVCARVNPEFMYGEYQIYNKEVHGRGSVTRRPDQPHGYHAMAIVGYSDDRQALLFMNSWGTEWGEDGFIWVDYALLNEFNYGEDKENLIEFAVVMRDRKEPVVKVDGKYQVVDSEDVQIGLFASYSDVVENGQQRFRFTATLRAQQKILDQVQAVRWTIPTLDGPKEIETQQGQPHRITAMSYDSNIQVKAIAVLPNGREINLDSSVELNSGAEVRTIEVKRFEAFHSRNENASGTYRASFLPQLNDADWRALKSISYELAPGTEQLVPETYLHDGGLPPEWSTNESAYLTLLLPDGPASGFANLEFHDGSSYSIPLPDDEFTLPVHDQLRSTVDWRLEGSDGDRNWYFYQVRVFFPELWTPDIRSVFLGIGGGVDYRYEQARFVDGPDQRMFVYSGYTTKPLLVRAHVTFDRYHPDYGIYSANDTLKVINVPNDESWISLHGDEAANYLERDAVSLLVRDEYLAETSEGPLFHYTLGLTGTVNLWSFDSVNWVLPTGEVFCHRDDEKGTTPADGFQISLVAGAEPFEIEAQLSDGFGQKWILKKTVTPHAQRNDAMFIDLEEHLVFEHDLDANNRKLSRAFLWGQSAKVENVSSIDAVVLRAWGGPQRSTIFSRLHEQPMPPHVGTVETLEKQETTFLVFGKDHSATTLTVLPHIPAPQPVAPTLQLEATDRYWGIKNEKPLWNVRAVLAGDVLVKTEIAKVEWFVNNLASEELPFVLLDEIGLSIAFDATLEVNITCKVHFFPESKRGSLEFDSPVHLLSPVLPNEPELQWEIGYMDPEIIETTPYPQNEMLETPLVARVVASPQFFEAWEKVQWNYWFEFFQTDGSEDYSDMGYSGYGGYGGYYGETENNEERGQAYVEPDETIDFLSDLRGGFPSHSTYGQPFSAIPLSVILISKNGDTLDLGNMVVGVDKESYQGETEKNDVVFESRYWGLMNDSPTHLLSVALGSNLSNPHLLSSKYAFDNALQAAGGGPSTAFDAPYARREFFASIPPRMESLTLQRIRPGYSKTKIDENEVKHSTIVFGPNIETSKVSSLVHHHPNTTVYALHMPEFDLVATQTVKYTVMQNGTAKVYKVTDRIGVFSDAFELRIPGSLPTEVTAQRFSGGQALGAPLSL